MHPRHRDGLLGLAATVALVVAARLLGSSPRRLARSHPRPLAAGALGAMAIELAMALAPDRALWGRRTARWGGTLLVAAGGPALALLAGPVILAALLGGLGAYFCLLAGALSGVVPPPETWFYDAPR